MHGQRIGYVRVSSFDQNPERQLEHVEVGRVFTDKASGKEQKIRIEASSGLSDAEVERMVKDAEAHAEEDRKRAMKWLKMHAQYDDAHPWEALEIICTLAGMNPTKALQAELRQAVCKSYDYMYLFLERCMQLEYAQKAPLARERLALVEG